MARLVLNRFKINLSTDKVSVSFYEENELENNFILKEYLYRLKTSIVLEKFDNKLFKTIKGWLNSLKKGKIEDKNYIFISFLQNNENRIQENVQFKDLPYFLKKRYIKEVLINRLKEKYIVEPFKEGIDFCVYEKVEETSNKYIRYDFNIYIDKDIELSLSIGSTDTYIGKFDLTNISTNKIKIVRDNLLIKKSNTEITSDDLVKANFQIRKNEDISPKPKFSFYKEHYEKIKAFLEKNNFFDYFTILSSFKEISKYDVVDFNSNKMVFANGHEDYSTINGMREYGPYKKPENLSQFQLLFIYPDSEAANKLFGYFSRGYRHFPGLESYVGIPANVSEIKINYNSKELSSIVDEINNKLARNEYENLIAVCIVPFSKTNATEKQSNIYFKIKQILLKKNIPSQFIERRKIFLDNFHYSLPNIAIAMLAKIGGIPWKLSKSSYDELIIGFNVYRKEKNIYMGSCVFFDNEGVIQELNFYPTSSIEKICKGLIQSIDKYKEDKNKNIERIVIHYYKPLNNEENKKIEKALQNLNINYVVVEVNDTKATTDLCFDLEYERFMPQSGTYVELKKNEYLIFNNLRYWEKPINPIKQEEFPIKVKIYDPNNTFDNQHHTLISQIYEFSRLYWKSLKQKAQPVTTIYSKLLAEYVANFDGQKLYDNDVARKTVWFI